MGKDSFLLDDLVKMHHVVGYQLPIHPTDYQVEITRGDEEHMMLMVSSYDVTRTEGCGIPFNCLAPLCKKRKRVVDRFMVNEEACTVVLQSTNAFGGLISWLEKGKAFDVIRINQSYLILVNPKEVFVLSPNKDSPNDADRNSIQTAVSQCKSSPRHIHLEYP
jgi:hypothetical protein